MPQSCAQAHTFILNCHDQYYEIFHTWSMKHFESIICAVIKEPSTLCIRINPTSSSLFLKMEFYPKLNHHIWFCFRTSAGIYFLWIAGFIVAVGVSSLQSVNMRSPRSLFIFGFSFFAGLAIPEWIMANPSSIETGVYNILKTIVTPCSISEQAYPIATMTLSQIILLNTNSHESLSLLPLSNYLWVLIHEIISIDTWNVA